MPSIALKGKGEIPKSLPIQMTFYRKAHTDCWIHLDNLDQINNSRDNGDGNFQTWVKIRGTNK